MPLFVPAVPGEEAPAVLLAPAVLVDAVPPMPGPLLLPA